jgi:hypothetical protein
MPYVKGFLKIVRAGHPDQGLPGGEGPVDPDYGIGIEQPDQGLPPVQGPVDPGFGWPLPPVIDNGLPGSGGRPTFPVRPDNSLPSRPGIWPQPPVGIWPPPPPLLPTHPIYPGGEHPDQGLPPQPPSGEHPDQGLPPSGEHPDQGLPPEQPHPQPPIFLPPGAVWPPLPPSIQGPILCFVWIVGVGYRWAAIDPSLTPDQGLPGSGGRPSHPIAPGGRPGSGGGRPSHPIAPGGRPDQGLPPQPQPKRT